MGSVGIRLILPFRFNVRHYLIMAMHKKASFDLLEGDRHSEIKEYVDGLLLEIYLSSIL
jgi:hypothetical protein